MPRYTSRLISIVRPQDLSVSVEHPPPPSQAQLRLEYIYRKETSPMRYRDNVDIDAGQVGQVEGLLFRLEKGRRFGSASSEGTLLTK